MMRRLRLATLLGLVAAAPLLAVDEPLFFDDFEAGDACAWTSISPAIAPISELEAPDRSSSENDLEENAQSISRCAVVDGVSGPLIHEGNLDFEDVDVYKFVATGPFLLRITLARGTGGTSDFEPAGHVDEGAGGSDYELGLLPVAADSMTSTREIWIPSSGTWYLRLLDARNVAEPTAGGIDDTYRLTLDMVPVSGTEVFPPPFTAEPLTIPADGSVVIYELDGASVGTLDFAETYAERLASPSLPVPDTKLFLVQPAGGSWTTVAENDDYDLFFDSRIPSNDLDPGIPLGTGPYFLIVDFWDIYDPDTFDAESPPAEFELDIFYIQAGF